MTIWIGVPLPIRRNLLGAWVQCKQMLHQPIPTTTYDINEVYYGHICKGQYLQYVMVQLSDGSTKQCQMVVAIEMISRQGNRLWEFPNIPTLQQV